MVESVSVKIMCASVGTLGEEDRLGSFGVRARKMCSDSEEDSSFSCWGEENLTFVKQLHP